MDAALAHAYPVLLRGLLAAWAAGAALALPSLRSRLAGARRGTAALLGLVLLGGLALRLSLPPAHQVYADEFEHLDVARRLAAGGAFGETVAGGLPSLDVYAVPPWPGGHHAALAAVFRAFGPGERAAFAWSALLSALAGLWVFWAALEVCGDSRGALAAALLWELAPAVLRYARAADTTSASAFWAAAALAALHARRARPGRALDAFAALSVAYACQVRFENGLLLPYAAWLGLPAGWLALPAASLAGPAALAWLNHARGVPGYGAFAPLSRLAAQGPGNLAWLLGPETLGLVALPAALLAARRGSEARRPLTLAAGLALGYSCFYHGAFADGADDRYAVAALPALLAAAAPALAEAALPAAALGAGLALAGPRPPDPAHEASRAFLARAAESLPPGTLVIAFNPPFAREVSGLPAATPAFALEGGLEKVAAARPLALWKDWTWWSRPEEGARLEASLYRRYRPRVVATEREDALVLLEPRP